MSNSSLSSVVSNLVRASVGTAVSSNVKDEDLDRHIADLILKEAKQKAERYGSEGVGAYLPQNNWGETNAPKPNKRFLSSIIRSTDDHNKAILQAQAQAAEEVRQERREQERKERKARAEEAVQAERIRRLMGGNTRDVDNWKRDDRRDSKGKQRERSWDRDDEERDRRDSEKDRERRRRDDERSERRHRHRHRDSRRSRSRSEGRHTSRRSRRDRSRSPHRRSHSPEERNSKRRRHRSRDRNASRSPRRSSRRHLHSRSRSPDEASSSHRTHTPRTSERSRGTRHRTSRSKSPISEKARREHSQPAKPSPSRQDTPSVVDSECDAVSREQLLRERLRTKTEQLKRPKEHSASNSRGRSRSRSRQRDSSPEVSPFPSVTSDTRTPASQAEPVPSTRSPSRSPSPPRRKHKRRRSRSGPRSPTASPPPLPPYANPPSKMDKYFSPTYDPRLDVAPLSTQVTVPKTGLINDEDFAGWEAMLELIRQRREDKADKKRLERHGVSKDTKKSSQMASEGIDIMSIEYKKRGAVREWDLGKEGF